jgi:hypothetical protein
VERKEKKRLKILKNRRVEIKIMNGEDRKGKR